MTETALSARIEITDKALVRSFSYINGKWCAAVSGETFCVTDPASGAILGDVAALSAVDAAQQAFAQWSGLLPQERSVILRHWFDLLIEHKEDLARVFRRAFSML